MIRQRIRSKDTLTLENGLVLQMTATVTEVGVLVVTAPATAGNIDVKQAVLMGAQVAKQSLNVELGSLSSALFVRILMQIIATEWNQL